jgi:hypothetical protein
VTAAYRHALRAPGWRLRNRWGLLLLPLATVAALAASSDRVLLYFWEEGLHRPTTGPAQQWVSFHDSYNDSNGDHQRNVRVRLDSVRPVTTLWQSSTPADLPPASTALAVTLSLQADSELPLTPCHLALRDADGNRYDYLPNAGGDQPISPCVPPDAPGPNAALGDFDTAPDPDARPRPAGWTVSPVIVLPAGVRVTEVDLWWEMPNYVALTNSG